MFKKTLLTLCSVFAISAFAGTTSTLPTYSEVQTSLKKIVADKNGGFGLNMWATIVDRDGIVKVVTFSGKDRGEQWPGSRAISAQKANTANAFSLPALALSTANLFTATQPGGSLFGLQFSNPVDTSVAYGGDSEKIGLKNDPMVGKKIGGVNVFGGGLALYNKDGKLVGALGVSGDSSCADHNIAWKLRAALKLDYVPAGISTDKNDNIVYDIENGVSKGGWGHPACAEESTAIAQSFSKTYPNSKK
jgi:uncharacterized protein GlcG (DUF336 family)